MEPNSLPSVFRRNRVSYDSLRAQVRARIAWSTLVRRRLAPRINIGAEEVAEILARLKASEGEDTYRLGEIFLSVNRPDEEAAIREDSRTSGRTDTRRCEIQRARPPIFANGDGGGRRRSRMDTAFGARTRGRVGRRPSLAGRGAGSDSLDLRISHCDADRQAQDCGQGSKRDRAPTETDLCADPGRQRRGQHGKPGLSSSGPKPTQSMAATASPP